MTGPRGVSVDGACHLYIADTSNSRIRRVDADTGIITTVAGNGREYSGDGGAAIEAGMGYPTSVVVDGSGHLYIADTFSNRIRRVDGVTGVITTVAGNGRYEFSGDGGAATEAGTTEPSGVSVDRDGTLYIAERNRIRRVDAVTGVITTVAGRGEFDFSAGGDPEVGDGGPATEAYLLDPSGVFVDGGGHLYIADAFNNRIRRVDADTGVITTVAGSEGFLGDHGLATEARLDQPSGVFADGAGHLYIADHDNHRIRLVNKSTGIITTVAGTGVRGFSGDGGLATKAGLSWP